MKVRLQRRPGWLFFKPLLCVAIACHGISVAWAGEAEHVEKGKPDAILQEHWHPKYLPNEGPTPEESTRIEIPERLLRDPLISVEELEAADDVRFDEPPPDPDATE